MSSILIIDDDKPFCRALQIRLRQCGQHEVTCAHTVADGLRCAPQAEQELVLLDLGLPDGNGLEVLRAFRAAQPELPVVVITGKQDTEAAIQAMREGAFDYVRKPFELDDVLLLLEKVRRRDKPTAAVAAETTNVPDNRHEIIGADRCILDVVKQIGLLSRNTVTVLITGESGTGKELVAKALHVASGKARPFVAVNCSAVVPTLFESELFGHEKGAFTGADARRPGELEHAQDGTIFLDEIGDLPSGLQAKLLRALQEKEFKRVGGREVIPLRARVVAATNRNLAEMVESGSFREDFYYRLTVSQIHVPPIRDRRGDIPLLVHYLLQRKARELHAAVTGIETTALERLAAYEWPGNVRELENAITRAIALSRGPVLSREDFAFLFPGASADTALESESGASTLRDVEKRHIARVLAGTGWNISQASRILDVSRTTLRKKISDYGLSR